MFLKLALVALIIIAVSFWWQRKRLASTSSRPNSIMTIEQAYAVLGLAHGSTRAEILSSHRRLMGGVHPDRGGSNYLAAQLNEARDRLLANQPN